MAHRQHVGGDLVQAFAQHRAGRVLGALIAAERHVLGTARGDRRHDPALGGQQEATLGFREGRELHAAVREELARRGIERAGIAGLELKFGLAQLLGAFARQDAARIDGQFDLAALGQADLVGLALDPAFADRREPGAPDAFKDLLADLLVRDAGDVEFALRGGAFALGRLRKARGDGFAGFDRLHPAARPLAEPERDSGLAQTVVVGIEIDAAQRIG